VKKETLRKNIDRIDHSIITLLNRRARAALAVGALKERDGDTAYLPSREREVLRNIERMSRGPMPGESLRDIYSEILISCRQLQRKLMVAYLGPEATFTHQAAVKNFGRGAGYVHCRTIPQVFEEIEKGRADYGVVPIENSNEGVVYHTLDMFRDSELKITMEINQPIHQYLVSTASSVGKVTRLFYHPQALGQCAQWVKRTLPGIETVEYSSTAESAKALRDDPRACAIASRVAAKVYRLNVLAGPIEDFRENVTRFLVIGRTYARRSGADKTSIMFSVKDRIGALHDMLLPFKRKRINLTKIESRPSRVRAWDYVFYVDLLGHVDEPRVAQALTQLERRCSFFKILGSYPCAS